MKDACIYCGNIAETIDYIPPKTLYPQPRPSNLIAVPACTICSDRFAADDVHFRDMLCLRQELSTNPAVLKLLDMAVRSTSERSMKDGSSEYGEDSFNKSLGIWSTSMMNEAKIRSTTERIVKGLYYIHNGRPLLKDYEVIVYQNEYLDSLYEEELEDVYNLIISPIENKPSYRIGESVFEYTFASLKDLYSSAWRLVFYEKYICYAVIIKKEAASEDR